MILRQITCGNIGQRDVVAAVTDRHIRAGLRDLKLGEV